MKTYRTAEVAKMAGIHANTVRLYEQLGLIQQAERLVNGYRVFTDFHVDQIGLIRLAFRVEVLQNGLRKKIVRMVKVCAEGDFDGALALTTEYLSDIALEMANAREAVAVAEQILQGEEQSEGTMRRSEVSKHLNISMDTLRNWEMNGLLTVKRTQNGYRVYTGEDIKRLKIIRSLKCANYSLAAILRMMGTLCQNPGADIKSALDTPSPDDEIITACDKLLTSLDDAQSNALEIMDVLARMKAKYR